MMIEGCRCSERTLVGALRGVAPSFRGIAPVVGVEGGGFWGTGGPGGGRAPLVYRRRIDRRRQNNGPAAAGEGERILPQPLQGAGGVFDFRLKGKGRAGGPRRGHRKRTAL